MALRDPFAWNLSHDSSTADDTIPSSDAAVQGTSDDACVSKLSAASLGTC